MNIVKASLELFLRGKIMIDTHAHYDDRQYDNDRDSLLESIFQNGVSKIITCATNFDNAEDVLRLCEKHKNLYAAVGVYPHETVLDKWDKSRFLDLLSHKKVVCVGEIGLDYHYDTAPRETQLEWIKNQLEVANEVNLPVTFHDREAHKDTMEILKKYRPKGAVHCFSGSVELARETVKLGLYIGVGGVLTFKNARVLKQVVEDTSIEKILLETDAPYMSPTPFRGKRNQSDYMIYIAEQIAQIKGMPVEEVIEITSANATELFKFKEG